MKSKHFNIWMEPTNEYAYFEHDEVGDDIAGGMWFNNKELVDYDGVFELPSEIIVLMESQGYNMDYAK